jgi:hypothetical protein
MTDPQTARTIVKSRLVSSKKLNMMEGGYEQQFVASELEEKYLKRRR